MLCSFPIDCILLRWVSFPGFFGPAAVDRFPVPLRCVVGLLPVVTRFPFPWKGVNRTLLWFISAVHIFPFPAGSIRPSFHTAFADCRFCHADFGPFLFFLLSFLSGSIFLRFFGRLVGDFQRNLWCRAGPLPAVHLYLSSCICSGPPYPPFPIAFL